MNRCTTLVREHRQHGSFQCSGVGLSGVKVYPWKSIICAANFALIFTQPLVVVFDTFKKTLVNAGHMAWLTDFGRQLARDGG